MKIAWLTPLCRTSGISRYSLAVVRSLSALHGIEVDVWYPDTGDDFACPWARARAFDRDGQPDLASYDAVFYNLGNYVFNHAAIYEYYLREPGFVVLHDKVMQGFFFGFANEMRHDPLHYVRLMRYVYGPEAQRFAVDGLLKGQSSAFWEKAGESYPLFEPCLFNATGVVSHSAETIALVDGRYPGACCRAWNSRSRTSSTTWPTPASRCSRARNSACLPTRPCWSHRAGSAARSGCTSP